ncbi:MAG: serine protease [Planctomycetota bacterium]
MSEYLECVARIFSAEEGKKTGNNGTAYPIARDRVITAAHVLDGRKNAEIWWNQKEEAKRLDWREAKVAWDGADEGIDVAVLQTEFPDAIANYAPLSLKPPQYKQPFESRGFAAIGKQEDDRKAVPITGEVIQYVKIDKEVSLGIQFGAEQEKDWKGASGSPVILNGILAAILANCPVGFSATRANAIPLCVLAQHHGFFDAIEFTADVEQLKRIREERRDVVVCRLEELLAPHKNVIQKLVLQLRQHDDTSELEKKTVVSEQAAPLSRILVSVQPKTALEALLAATDSENPTLNSNEKELIREISQLVLPVTIDTATRHLAKTNDSFELKAISDAMAELAIASLESRSARFRSNHETDDLPTGLNKLPNSSLISGEGGDTWTIDDQVNATIRHLAEKTPGVPKMELRYTELPEAIEILRDCLRELRRDQGSLYYVFRPSLEKEDSKKREIAIALKQKIQELAIIDMKGGSKEFRQEFKELKSLRDLLVRVINQDPSDQSTRA